MNSAGHVYYKQKYSFTEKSKQTPKFLDGGKKHENQIS
jgi:hypothetical protein